MSSAFQPWENPMGTAGFEFIEYAAPDPAALRKVFELLGFKAIAKHRHKGAVGESGDFFREFFPLVFELAKLDFDQFVRQELRGDGLH